MGLEESEDYKHHAVINFGTQTDKLIPWKSNTGKPRGGANNNHAVSKARWQYSRRSISMWSYISGEVYQCGATSKLEETVRAGESWLLLETSRSVVLPGVLEDVL